MAQLLLTHDAEIVMEHFHRAIGVDDEVLAFMDEVVVSRALSDDSEIIDEGDIDLAILKKTLEVSPE
jgi:energy-coupling factor transporter ATP-binding protein EcfA2